MPDGWELRHQLKPLVDDSTQDQDNDGLNNFIEFQLGLDPDNNDTDNDLLNDKDEMEIYGTDPLIRDMDNDTLGDGFEILAHRSSHQ